MVQDIKIRFFRAVPTTASTFHLSSRTLLETAWQRKRYVWIANRLSSLTNLVEKFLVVCILHSTGAATTTSTACLVGVRLSRHCEEFRPALAREGLSSAGSISHWILFYFAKVHLCGVREMDRALARRQLVSLGQHALLHHRCRQ